MARHVQKSSSKALTIKGFIVAAACSDASYSQYYRLSKYLPFHKVKRSNSYEKGVLLGSGPLEKRFFLSRGLIWKLCL